MPTGRILALLLSVATARSLALGISFDDGGLPLLRLPYGVWRASAYDADGDVRAAAPR